MGFGVEALRGEETGSLEVASLYDAQSLLQ
jgi:hypothetical protein